MTDKPVDRDYHPLYIQRLANVYIEKHRNFGYDVAKKWYEDFIPNEIKESVNRMIQSLTSVRK